MDTNDLIRKYKNIILNLIIIGISVIISLKIYTSQGKDIASLTVKKDAETKKNEVLQDISRLENKFKAYKKYINNKEVSKIINMLGAIAKENSVNIISIRPLEEKPFPLYTKYPYDLSIEADSYHALARFVSNVESHGYIFRVESAVISKQFGSQDEHPKLKEDLLISTIVVKD